MIAFRHYSLFLTGVFLSLFSCSRPQTLEQAFLSPPEDAKPIMIWQWMDGLVTKEGITQDLEAYQKAGIGGVQQFLVGSETQILVKDYDAFGNIVEVMPGDQLSQVCCHPYSRALLNAVYCYMTSDDFRPEAELSETALKEIVACEAEL